VLTVRYERLGLVPGDRLLDMGSGGGRHAYEAMRRGAVVTALDADAGEMKDVSAMLRAFTDEEPPPRRTEAAGAALVGDALRLPFGPGAFDRVIAAEVLEHIPDDGAAMGELFRVLRPGGTLAVTVPRWWPERLIWALSDEYHHRPGGHIRIYRRGRLVDRLRAAGLQPYAAHHAHALHSPYWWLRAAVGVANESHPMVRRYHQVLVWDITAASPVTRVPEALLNPVLGKSLVVYLRKPA
jgi:SAM-dependent methyltransferase